MQIRPAYFAAQGWYPADPARCRSQVEQSLATAVAGETAARSGLVPHAGWLYSGQTAARTFAGLGPVTADLVFLFGGHMRPGSTPRLMPSGAFETPLGPLEVDSDLAAELCKRFKVERESATEFEPDNTIELQLPFVRARWPEAKVVAVQVPPGAIAQELGLWAAEQASERGLEAVAIGSTDLTHYGDNYGFTPHGYGDEAHRWSKEQNDRPFLQHALALEADTAMQHALENHSACCPGAAGAAIAFARGQGALHAELIEHTTSHEVAKQGSPRMWVGYASVVFGTDGP